MSTTTETGTVSPSIDTNDDCESVVVVGNGPVGFRFLQRLIERQLHNKCRVRIFGEEPQPAYDRVNLTKYLDDADGDQLQYEPRSWYEQHGIELFTDDPVIEINRQQRTIVSRSGRQVAYDRLILATGSRPFIPPIPGIHQSGVFAYRTVEDLQCIREYATRSQRAVVLGGGLLGLEAAHALTKLGVSVFVIEMAPVLMPRQLDNAGAGLLKTMVQGPHLKVLLQRQTISVNRIESGLHVQFNGGESVVADMVVVSAGIRPRDELATACGLSTGARGGIVVNDQLRTADPSIYAIGECAEHQGKLYGLAAPGFQMATTLAESLIGRRAAFQGSNLATRLKLVGVNVVFCGEYLDLSGASTLTWQTDDCYTKLIVRRGRIVGMIGVGKVEQFDRLQEAIDQKRTLFPWHERRFERTGKLWNDSTATSVSAWPEKTVVCSCMGVTRGELTAACLSGCGTVKALSQQTGASTVCGSCLPLVQQLAGEPGELVDTAPQTGMVITSAIAALLISVLLLVEPIALPTSVQSAATIFQTLISDVFWKQVTGYSLAGLSALSLVISLRKRTRLLDRFEFSSLRLVHVVLATAALGVLVGHTGFHRGSNLNFVLFCTFMGAAVTGAMVGFVTGMEARLPRLFRSIWRPLTLTHILCLWPLPVLIVFHVISVYWL